MDEFKLTAEEKLLPCGSCDHCCRLAPFRRAVVIDGFTCDVFQCKQCGDEMIKGMRRGTLIEFADATG